MRALAPILALAAAGFVLAGCPSRGACPVDTISSASQCIPIDMAVPDMTMLSSQCPPTSSLGGPGTPQPLPPCVVGTRCFYPTPNDDAGLGSTECDCRPDHRWVCLAQ